MRRKGTGYLIAGGLLVGIILLMAIFAEQITTVSPYYFHATKSVLEGSPPFKPSATMPLGTDQFGRDVWSRVAFGARWSLFFAFLIMGARLLVAIPMAILSTFGHSWFRRFVSRLYVLTGALPPLLVYVLLLSSKSFREIGLWPSVIITVSLLTLMEWPRIAVQLRGRLEELSMEPFVEGATAAGATGTHIFWSHLMPHLWPTLLQVVVAEMGRGLLNIAQLGFFGIWVGGGIIDLVTIDEFRPPIWITSTGIPEWGTLLADAREYISRAPWIPLAPATAFFVAVAGFNLLSQGLEGLVISTSGLRDRLTKQVRWALRGVAVAALVGWLLWHHHGLPWGKEAGIAALASRQAELLAAGDVEGYLETLLADDPALRDGQRIMFTGWEWDGLAGVKVEPLQMRISGGDAYGLWSIQFMYKGARTSESLVRSVHLVRRGGQWYDAGDGMSTIRGLHTEVHAYYDPTSPKTAAMNARHLVNLLSSVADHAYNQAVDVVPWGARADRAVLRVYPSHSAYVAAIQGIGAQVDTSRAKVWQSPDDVLHISPDFTAKLDRKRLREELAFEMVKYLTKTGSGDGQVLPVLMGTMELKSYGQAEYPLLISPLLGQQLFELEGLLGATPEELTQDRRPVYLAQSALLAEWLESRSSSEQVFKAFQAEDPQAALAEALGIARGELSGQYRAYLWERLAGRSILNLPGGKARTPVELLEAIRLRAEAATGAEPSEFVGWSDLLLAEKHAEWQASLRRAGVAKYEAQLLDVSGDGVVERKVTLLERYTFADGREAVGMSSVQWVFRSGRWVAGQSVQTWAPAGVSVQ